MEENYVKISSRIKWRRKKPQTQNGSDYQQQLELDKWSELKKHLALQQQVFQLPRYLVMMVLQELMDFLKK